MHLTEGGTWGSPVDFLNSSPVGTSVMQIGTVASATATREVVIPDDGVLFTSGIYITYLLQGAVPQFKDMTAFHA